MSGRATMAGGVVPASPSMSPGRRIYRTVPQSPSIGFRTSGGSTFAPAGIPMAVAARHSKSTSDLGQARRSRYDPARLGVGPPVSGSPSITPALQTGSSRGASPPPPARPMSPREGVVGLTPPRQPRASAGCGATVWSSFQPSTARPASSPLRTAGTAGWVKPYGASATLPLASMVPSGVASISSSTTGASAAGSPAVAGVVQAAPVAARPWAMNGGGALCRSSPRQLSQVASFTGTVAAVRSGSVGVRHLVADVVQSPRTSPPVGIAMRVQDRASLSRTSPRPEAARRTHSYQHLEAPSLTQAIGFTTMAPTVSAVSVVSAVPSLLAEGRDEALIPVRDSLLQNIQKVQQEINRLQMSSQVLSMGAAVTVSPRASGRTHLGTSVGATPNVSTSLPTENHLQQMYLQQQPSGSLVESAVEKARRLTATGLVHREPQVRLYSAGSSMVVGAAGVVPVQAFCQPLAPSGASRGSGIAAGPYVTAASAASAASVPRVAAEVLAVIRLQRWWRNALRRRACGRRTAQSNGMHIASSSRLRPAVNHAACRIQRAWRISRWRRRFVDYSERDLGWVGSLEWLQHHNLLYGTELADPEDVRWWMQQRHGAPLDRDVDPWGCTKLRDHLNKMWYGRTTEELQELARQEEALRLQQEQQEREQRYSAMAAEVAHYAAYGAHVAGQEVIAYYDHIHGHAMPSQGSSAALLSGRSVSLDASMPNTLSAHGVAGSFRSPQRVERAVRLTAGKATSLSPRRDAPMWRAQAEALGSRAARVGFGGQVVVPMVAQSPLQTHRSTRTLAIVASQAAGLRARSPLLSASRAASCTAPPANAIAAAASPMMGSMGSMGCGAAVGASPMSSRLSLTASSAAPASARPSQPSPLAASHRALGSSPQLSLVGRQHLPTLGGLAMSQQRRPVLV